MQFNFISTPLKLNFTCCLLLYRRCNFFLMIFYISFKISRWYIKNRWLPSQSSPTRCSDVQYIEWVLQPQVSKVLVMSLVLWWTVSAMSVF